MKVRLIQFFAVIILMASFTQAQWNWEQTVGGQTNGGTSSFVNTWGTVNNSNSRITLNSNGNYYGRNVAVDASGNTYVAVSYDSTDIYIGSAGNPVAAVGGRTILLYKLNSSGVLQWYRRMGHVLGQSNINSICLDEANGKIFLTGNYCFTQSIQSSLDGFTHVGTAGTVGIAFETSTPGSFTSPFTITNYTYGITDAFVACYTTSGAFSFANQINIPSYLPLGQSYANSIIGGCAADGLGNYYIGIQSSAPEIQVNNTGSPYVFKRWGPDSTFYLANGAYNPYINNSYIGGADLTGKNISAISVNSTNLIAASGTNVYMSYDNGATWRQIDNGALSSNVTSVNTSIFGTWLVTNSNGLYAALNTTTTSNGITWPQISSTPNITCVNTSGAISNIAYGTSDAGLFYTYTGSTAGGVTWIQQDGFSSHNIRSTYYANSGKTLLAGVNNDGLYYTTRGSTTVPFGSSWTKAPGIYNQSVYYVTNFTGSPAGLVACADSGLYISYTNSPAENGNAWHKWGPGPVHSDAMALLPVTSVIVNSWTDPIYSYSWKVVVGTSQGAYVTYSFDGQNTWSAWTKVGNGLNGQSIPVNGIQQTNTRYTWFATSSAGVIYSTWTGLQTRTYNGSTYNFSSINYAPMLFGKFNSSGQCVWITAPRTWDGQLSMSSCQTYDIVADNSAFYVSGNINANHALLFEGGSFKTAVSTTNNYATWYAKYDLNGTPQWAHQSGLTNPNNYPATSALDNAIISLALDGSGNLYGTGWSTSNYLAFDGYPTTPNINQGFDCMFLAKFNGSTGNCNWLTQDGYGASVSNDVYGTAVSVDAANNRVFVGGSVKRGMTIAGVNIIPGTTNKYNPFLAVYNTLSGAPINAVQLSSATLDAPLSYMSVRGTTVTLAANFMNDNITLLGTNYPKQATGNNSQYNFFLAQGTYGSSLFTTSAAAPTKVLPANAATGLNSTSVHFQWNTVPSADCYKLTVSKDALFTSNIVFTSNYVTTNDTTITSIPLANNQAYFWRVASRVSGVWSDSLSTWKYTSIGAVPNVPTLSSPANGTNNVVRPVPFSWTAAASNDTSIVYYRIQVATDNAFASIVYDKSNIILLSQQVTGLASNTSYYWRVLATNAIGSSAYSTYRSLKTARDYPAAPTLTTYPAGDTTGVGTAANSITFMWNTIADSATYTVQYSTKPDFSSGSATVSTTGAPTTFKANTAVLTANTVYYWHVQAVNQSGSSPYSATRRFSTTTAAAPNQPTLSSPADGNATQNHNVSFSWSSPTPTLPESYELQVATDNLFSSIVYDNSSILGSVTSQAVNGLNDGATYYWRLKATNFIGSSAWSLTRSFTTLGPLVSVFAVPQGFYRTDSLRTIMRDTVTIELHNATAPYALVESHKAVFDSVNFSGLGLMLGRAYSYFTTAITPGSNYYVAVKHRNSVETWSDIPYPMPLSSTMTYNFTDYQTKSYGSNLTKVGAVWCIYSGDVNGDGIVDSGDLGAVDNDNANYVSGYVVTDVNGDGIVDSGDLGIVDNNNANYVGKIVPTGPPTAVRITRPAKVKSVNQ
jgi:hypothetical protein